jgi:predicted amidohydrolase
MGGFSRRAFIKNSGVVAGLGLGGAPLVSNALPGAPQKQRVTLAQVPVGRDVKQNMHKVREGFAIAKHDKARWLLFPEGMVSGYWGGFDQKEVAAAFEEIAALANHAKVTALVGSSWREKDDRVFNQLRIIGPDGQTLGAYGKKVLTYGDAMWAAPGESELIFESGGDRFGTLICNDLWVTPGFCDGPDPRLTLAQSRGGAKVIFHAISSGANLKYRAYHESNLLTRAAEARCPIVAVNAFPDREMNVTSGVVGTDFEYIAKLPRDREAVQTVEFELGSGEGPRVR